MRAILAAFVAILWAGGASAQTVEQLAAAERAGAVGLDLYDHDRAAWLGTDAMLAEIRDPRAEGLRGWITEQTSDGVALTFVKGEGDDLSAAYRAVYRDGALREHSRVDYPLTAAQARLYRARQVAIAAPIERCAPSYNSVVLPRAVAGTDGADIDVYLMPASEQPRQMPMGGHYRVAVDSTAGVIRETAQFTNTCLAQDDAQALFVTQVIGETPTEIHVFASLSAHMPIYVMTRSGVWKVDGYAVRFEREAPPPN